MNCLLFLGHEDFNTQKGTKGDILCTRIPGFSLVLFYSTQCEHCHTLIPIFKQLPKNINGCQFGMINVGVNKQCVQMSRNTIAPITYVPYIVLYVNGKPHMSYKGPHDIAMIKQFVVEVAKNVQSKQKFMPDEAGGGKHEKARGSIPQYTIGKPLYGEDDKVCYLEFLSAYKK